MGSQISIEKRFHVSLAQYEDIVNDTYTVKRTSEELDDGWKISHESGVVTNVKGPSATKHCTKDETRIWRIFMDNGKNSDDYVCGWRRLETIQPTRLNNDEEAIKMWRETLKEILEALEVKRLETDVEK